MKNHVLQGIFGLALVIAPLATTRAQPPLQGKAANVKPPTVAEPPTLAPITWDELKQHIGGPTLVTLNAQNMPVLQVLDELAKQSPQNVTVQNRVQWERGTPKTLTANYQKQPFWSVARDAGAKLGFRAYSYGRPGLTIGPWNETQNGLTTTTGPAIFALLQTNYKRSLDLGTTQKPAISLRLSGRVYVDPKLRWLPSSISIGLDEAVDENGQSLLPVNSDGDNLNSDVVPADFTLNLKPSATSKIVRRLRGTLRGAVAYDAQPWQIPDVLKVKNLAKNFKAGDVTERLEVQEVSADGNNYRVILILSQPDLRQRARARLSTGRDVVLSDLSELYANLRLFDARGHELQRADRKIRREGDIDNRITTIEVTFTRRADDGETTDVPARLQISYNTDWRELAIPFSFSDVPLP